MRAVNQANASVCSAPTKVKGEVARRRVFQVHSSPDRMFSQLKTLLRDESIKEETSMRGRWLFYPDRDYNNVALGTRHITFMLLQKQNIQKRIKNQYTLKS